ERQERSVGGPGRTTGTSGDPVGLFDRAVARHELAANFAGRVPLGMDVDVCIPADDLTNKIIDRASLERVDEIIGRECAAGQLPVGRAFDRLWLLAAFWVEPGDDRPVLAPRCEVDVCHLDVVEV